MLTGSTLTIPIFFTQKSDNIGVSTDYSQVMTTLKTTVTVSGVTDNKLESVRSFDYQNKYKVGNNGATEVTPEYVKYNINGIDYQTYFKDLVTSFKFTTEREVYTNTNFVHEDFNLGYVDKTQVQDIVDIERQKISVIESFSKLRQISVVEEIEVFGNRFYKINNQTI